ncbi:MAG TPA: hypothetical protein VE009_05185 [Paenibacillus sp.]|nr:hypothetical protein [Paenibacillus sp.]HZG84319.1 hypothetical protein [Paenibacillus sp.]
MFASEKKGAHDVGPFFAMRLVFGLFLQRKGASLRKHVRREQQLPDVMHDGRLHEIFAVPRREIDLQEERFANDADPDAVAFHAREYFGLEQSREFFGMVLPHPQLLRVRPRYIGDDREQEHPDEELAEPTATEAVPSAVNSAAVIAIFFSFAPNRSSSGSRNVNGLSSGGGYDII